jgi:hypothetical protein
MGGGRGGDRGVMGTARKWSSGIVVERVPGARGVSRLLVWPGSRRDLFPSGLSSARSDELS